MIELTSLIRQCYTKPMFPWQPRRPIHTSWLVALFCAGISVGVFSSAAGYIPLYSMQWLLAGVTLFMICAKQGRVYVAPIVIIAGVMIGLWRGNNHQLQLIPYESLVGKTVTLTGKVTDDSDTGKHGEMVLRLGAIVIDDKTLAGSVWVSAGGNAEVKRGDMVTLKGKLGEGFGSFAASMYQAKLVKLERPVPGDVALQLRDWFAGGVRSAVPEPEASLGVGYVVGQRRSLPEELDTALRSAGLTHIVVASGYNLTILVTMARRLFARISKFLAAFMSGSLTLAFIAVTGLSPSMTRAGLVTGLALLAWYYGRRFHPLVLLPLAAAITLLINPSYGYNDLGWQLSFAAFSGVLLLAPLLQNFFFGAERPGILRQVLFETVSAWLCTMPLIAVTFGQLSIVAIIANMLVLPLVPLAMLLTFAAGIASLFVSPLSAVLGFPATLVLSYMTHIAIYLGNLSWAQIELTMTPVALGAYYLILIAFAGIIWRKTRASFLGATTITP